MNILRQIFNFILVSCFVAFVLPPQGHAFSDDESPPRKEPHERISVIGTRPVDLDFGWWGFPPGFFGGGSGDPGQDEAFIEGGLNEDKDKEGEGEQCRAGNTFWLRQVLKLNPLPILRV